MNTPQSRENRLLPAARRASVPAMPPDSPQDWSYGIDAQPGAEAASEATPVIAIPSNYITRPGLGAPGIPLRHVDDEPVPYAPRPKPPIRPIRVDRAATDEGEGWRTEGLYLRHAGRDAYYLTLSPAQGEPCTVFLRREHLARLTELAASPTLEPGHLWRLLSDIPLERPLPSRRLDAELRALLSTFAFEILR